MKSFAAKLSLLLLMIPTSTFAAWQVAKPTATIPSEPFFQARTQPSSSSAVIPVYGSRALPTKFANLGRPAAVYAISVSGSLKENIERIMDRYHWKVVWKVGYDYNFDGRVTGSSLPNVIEKLLAPFPLQAQMYMSNRTMTVVPRKV